MWGGDTYAGFDVSKAHPPQPVGLLSRGDGCGGGILSLIADTGRLCPKEVPLSDIRYMKG